MAASIQVCRLSLIWTDVDLAQPDTNAPLGRLRRRADYEATIDRLRAVNGHDNDLRLPWWRKTPPHFFWLYYFNRLLPERVSGSTAWQALAPLQLATPMATLQKSSAGVSGDLRGYVAPQASALVADIKLIAALSPTQWVEQCHAIRNGQLDVAVPGEAVQQLRLQDAANAALARLRERLGQGPAEHALAEPFSVVTVVKAEGLSETPPGKPVLQWVHAVSGWPAVWRQVAGDPAGSIPLRRRDLAKSDLFYGTARGRVQWMPSRALRRPTDRPISTMSCYHHNVTLASMQIEMLLDFVRTLSAANEPVRLAWSSVGQRAAGLLGRLYGGTDDTYRSASIARQIKDSGLIDTIDVLRELHNMKKLDAAA